PDHAVFGKILHLAENAEPGVFLNVAEHLVLTEKMRSLFAGRTVLALGYGSDGGVDDLAAADLNRHLRVHVGDDMSERAIHPLIRRVKGQRADAGRGI